MSNPKFIKEPGFVFDVMHIFIYHFNKTYLNECLEHNTKTENIEFWNSLETNFSQIPDELLLFFYIKDNGKCFLPQYCFYNNVEKYLVDYKFEDTLNDILDTERVTFNMIQFFFPEMIEEEVEECYNDFKRLVKVIHKSNYSDFIKTNLCAFFADNEYIIKKLHFELIEKGLIFKQYYEKNYIQIAKFQNSLDFTKLAQNLLKWKEKKFKIDLEKDIYVSPCIIAKGSLNICFSENVTLLVLGVEVDARIDFVLNHTLEPELDVFGNAISEKNRIGIINALLERKEMPIRDIEKMFGISNTNAYYHLTLMIKAGIINVRNEGRTMLYSLNRSYFDSVIEALKKYGVKWGGIGNEKLG